jgi:glycosyltransferase involved in cell wall biosynthesis
MRIFSVCADRGIPPGGAKGASIHLRSLARALRQEGAEVVLFTERGPEPGPEAASIQDLDVRPLDLLAEAAEVAPPDIVYERYSLGSGVGLAQARRIGCAFVLEVNAPLLLEANLHRPGSVPAGAARIEEQLFREADLVVAVSEPLRRIVAGVRGKDAGTAVVWNGADEKLLDIARMKRPEETATLVFLGNPKPWHGAETLPDLMARLEEKGCPARLLVIGGGKGADSLMARAREQGIDDRVEITGPVASSRVGELLSRADVAIAPYPPADPFYFCPLKVIESMMAGLPVVTTRQGDLEAITRGAALLVPPGDPEALVEAVRSLLESPDTARELGERARERAASALTWRHSARSLLALVPGAGVSRGQEVI